MLRLLEPLQRVLGPALEADLEVEPGAVAAAGSGRSQDVARRQVRIEGLMFASVIQHHHETVAPEVLSEGHRALVDRLDRGVLGGVDLGPVLDRVGVEARVLATPEARAHAAARRPGQRAAEGGEGHRHLAVAQTLE